MNDEGWWYFYCSFYVISWCESIVVWILLSIQIILEVWVRHGFDFFSLFSSSLVFGYSVSSKPLYRFKTISIFLFNLFSVLKVHYFIVFFAFFSEWVFLFPSLFCSFFLLREWIIYLCVRVRGIFFGELNLWFCYSNGFLLVVCVILPFEYTSNL